MKSLVNLLLLFALLAVVSGCGSEPEAPKDTELKKGRLPPKK